MSILLVQFRLVVCRSNYVHDTDILLHFQHVLLLRSGNRLTATRLSDKLSNINHPCDNSWGCNRLIIKLLLWSHKKALLKSTNNQASAQWTYSFGNSYCLCLAHTNSKFAIHGTGRLSHLMCPRLLTFEY